jgi:pimeloyl-ACP methyl ester carboxylesterase
MSASEIEHITVATNGIDMHVATCGSGPPVVLCHGFPELWYSWRHQLPALADAGYRAIAPDQRGYGQTTAPPDVGDYTVLELAADLTGMLDALGEERAVFVGHDWGAIVVWQLALLAPERVAAVANLSVPFLPRAPVPPTQLFRALTQGRFFYILYFQAVGPAEGELDRDPRASLRALFGARSWGGRSDEPEDAGLLARAGDAVEIPEWLTEADLDVYAAEFARTGFTPALNWYRNFDRNWELTADLAGAKVEPPALFVTGERDPVSRFAPAAMMDGWLSDPRGRIVLPGAGHWTQQERPDEVNRILLEFLANVWPVR